VVGRSLRRDGRELEVRGVAYSPLLSHAERYTSPPDIFVRHHRDTWMRDLPLIAALGANTVRLYNWDPALHATDLTFLDACAELGLSVVLPVSNYFLDHPEAAKPIITQAAHHPAVLMWGVSNEASDIDCGECAMSSANVKVAELTRAVRQAEAAAGTWHPITVPVTCSNLHVPALASAGALVDVWGFNCYWAEREAWPANFYELFAAASDKPMLMTEWGIDSFDNRVGEPFEAVQASYTSYQWTSLISHRGSGGISLGGVVFEWLDEPWKANYAGALGASCVPARPGVQAGWGPNGFPDSCGNEAFFGMAELRADETLRLKPICNELARLWGAAPGNTLPSSVLLQPPVGALPSPQRPVVAAVAVPLLALLLTGVGLWYRRRHSISTSSDQQETAASAMLPAEDEHGYVSL